eukprot:640732-Prymnesium_polylepis.1
MAPYSLASMLVAKAAALANEESQGNTAAAKAAAAQESAWRETEADVRAEGASAQERVAAAKAKAGVARAEVVQAVVER